jgi:hypothetical protein
MRREAMKKSARELVKLAATEGIRRPKVIPGTPHARLVGEYNGKPFSMVCCLSKSLEADRVRAYARSNIRQAIRKLNDA